MKKKYERKEKKTNKTERAVTETKKYYKERKIER
jgi:hypothetical protein